MQILTLNSTISNVMLINCNLRDKEKFGNLKTENSEICITSTIKYLGIHMDKELNFKYKVSHHIDCGKNFTRRWYFTQDQNFSSNIYSFMCILQSCAVTSKLWHYHMGITVQIILRKINIAQKENNSSRSWYRVE